MATTNLGLTQYTAGQTIKFITSTGNADYNHDMLKIDTAVGNNNTSIGKLETSVLSLGSQITSLDTRVDTLETRDDDWVVDEGTSGIWKYTKFHSGICEIDTVLSIGYDAGTAFGTGGLYFHKTTGTILYPFTINNAKACICKQDATLAWHCGSVMATGDFSFYVVNAASGVISSASAGYWHVNIRGTWK